MFCHLADLVDRVVGNWTWEVEKCDEWQMEQLLIFIFVNNLSRLVKGEFSDLDKSNFEEINEIVQF